MLPAFQSGVYVCRRLGANYGRRCRIVSVKPRERDAYNRTIVHVGDEPVAVDFGDGVAVELLRRELLLEDGLQARQILAKVAS